MYYLRNIYFLNRMIQIPAVILLYPINLRLLENCLRDFRRKFNFFYIKINKQFDLYLLLLKGHFLQVDFLNFP